MVAVVDSVEAVELSDATSEELVVADSAVVVLVVNVVKLSDTTSEELVLADSVEVEEEMSLVVAWVVSEDAKETVVDALEDSVAVESEEDAVSEEVVRDAPVTTEDDN